MKRFLALSLLALVASHASPRLAAAQVTYITMDPERGTKVPVVNGDTPSVVSGRGFIATGAAADNLTRCSQPPPPSVPVEVPPPRPKLVQLLRDGKVHAGLTELWPGSAIFMASRHAFQDSAWDVAQAFSSAGIDLTRYAVLEFKSGDTVLDALVFVPRERISELLLEELSSTPVGISRPTYRWKNFAPFQRAVELGDHFFSLQFGTTGNLSTTQMSKGQIFALAAERFLLPLSTEDQTTLRSSGSVVYIARPSRSEWKIGGLVECLIPPTKSAAGVPIPGGVQVLPASELLRSRLMEVNLEEILKERPESDPNCIKIDARGGGGG